MTDFVKYRKMHSHQERNFLGHFMVSLVAMFIFLANISHSGLWHPDAASHALNGVFYKDMIEEGGFLRPKTYAERYYVQYPSLTIGMYPPVFYTTEALVFKVFGVSPLTARLAVLLFTLLGVNIFFLLCRLWFSLWLSVIGGILYLFQPITLFGQKNVMLEMPALTMSMVALYCLYIGAERDNRRALFLTPVFMALAFLTKQNTIFLLPIWFVWVIAGRKWSVIKSGRLILGVLIGIVILIPWVIVNLTVGRYYVSVFGFQIYQLLPNFLYYVRHSSEIVSYPVAFLSILSVILFMKLTKHQGYKFTLLWGCSILLCMLITEHGELRYAMFVVPPLIILSIHVIGFLRHKFSSSLERNKVYAILMVLLICLHVMPQNVWSSRDLQGADKAADFVVSDGRCVSVLYDGYWNGNFIFHVRARDEDRRIFIFRASKVIFSTKMRLDLGYKELVDEISEFYDILNRYSIKYIVQEEKDLLNTPANRKLRQWIQEPNFRLVQKYPVSFKGLNGFGSLLVYEYLDYEAKPIREVELDMPIMGQKISVKLEEKK